MDDAGGAEQLDGTDLGVLSEHSTTVTREARRPSRLVHGAAPLHPHPLVLGSDSVHTSPETLRQGEEGIARIQSELHERLADR